MNCLQRLWRAASLFSPILFFLTCTDTWMAPSLKPYVESQLSQTQDDLAIALVFLTPSRDWVTVSAGLTGSLPVRTHHLINTVVPGELTLDSPNHVFPASMLIIDKHRCIGVSPGAPGPSLPHSWASLVFPPLLQALCGLRDSFSLWR